MAAVSAGPVAGTTVLAPVRVMVCCVVSIGRNLRIAAVRSWPQLVGTSRGDQDHDHGRNSSRPRPVSADPTERALQLLPLLQTHRFGPGEELPARLGVSARTLRRDVERLRSLGYPVDATPGSGGGYRLAAGAHLPPLLLDDEDAVAIAVG